MRIKEEISSRIMRANRNVQALNKLLRNKNISRGAKLKTYKTVIRPILTYASETWVITKMEQDMILVWERKVLWKIFGVKVESGQWERRTNKELEWRTQCNRICQSTKTQMVRPPKENASIEDIQNDFDKHNRRQKEKRKTLDKMEHRSNKKYTTSLWG